MEKEKEKEKEEDEEDDEEEKEEEEEEEEKKGLEVEANRKPAFEKSPLALDINQTNSLETPPFSHRGANSPKFSAILRHCEEVVYVVRRQPVAPLESDVENDASNDHRWRDKRMRWNRSGSLGGGTFHRGERRGE
uniref:Uncharacterized protein n=1 Tax=Vespula pensylvanica TaxID=30213 RepID=A0A834NS87_VESPE|nr:hypothetical protein H0235_011554 [Vespula pensylvanica]